MVLRATRSWTLRFKYSIFARATKETDTPHTPNITSHPGRIHQILSSNRHAEQILDSRKAKDRRIHFPSSPRKITCRLGNEKLPTPLLTGLTLLGNKCSIAFSLYPQPGFEESGLFHKSPRVLNSDSFWLLSLLFSFCVLVPGSSDEISTLQPKRDLFFRNQRSGQWGGAGNLTWHHSSVCRQEDTLQALRLHLGWRNAFAWSC